MTNRDDLLQHYIAMLESGTPLEDVLNRLPEGEEHLSDLLRLTAAIRAVPRPETTPVVSQNGRVYSLIQERARKKERPFLPEILRRGWAVPRLALSGLAAVALLVLGVIWFKSLNNQILTASALTLAEASGQIEATEQDSAAWQPISAGQPLAAGQSLRSGPGSTATLEFIDGSRLHLAANSELAINVLEQPEDETLVVELTQRVGQTRHQVTPLRSPDALYVVHTPSAEAAVRGTTFSVAVAADGHAYFAVDEGEVVVTAGGTAVPITAGHTTDTRSGRAPATPVRYFRSQGELLRQDRTLWIIDEMLVYVTEETILADVITVGDWVQVSGRILPNGRWQADSVELAADTVHQAAFAGVLQAMTTQLWLVDGISLLVTGQTERPSDLAVGDLVRVVYVPNSDGHRLALQIERLAQAAVELPENAFQPARPSLSFEPDELEAAACETTFTLTGSLENSGEPPQDVAANVELGYALLTGTQFVETIMIDPANWEAIAAGEAVSFTVQVELNAAWLDARSETEVKLRLFIAAESNRPDHHVTQLTITLVQTCDPPTDTPTATRTVTGTVPTFTPTPTPTPLLNGSDCTGVSPHPEGMRLAQIYGVTYEEIIGWFCEGFGFGEIDLAYGLGRDSGTAVADIFAMRRQGLGWGEIMQALGLLPGPPSNPPSNPPSSPPGNPSATPEPEPEDEDEPPPPIIPPGPSMTPPTPPIPPNTPPEDDS